MHSSQNLTTQDFQFPHNQFLTVSHDFLCSSYFHQHAKVTISASGEVSASASTGTSFASSFASSGASSPARCGRPKAWKASSKHPASWAIWATRNFREKRVVGPQCWAGKDFAVGFNLVSVRLIWGFIAKKKPSALPSQHCFISSQLLRANLVYLVWKPAAFQEILAVLQTTKFNVIPEPLMHWHDQGSKIRSLFSGCLEAKWHKAPMAWNHTLVLQVSMEMWPRFMPCARCPGTTQPHASVAEARRWTSPSGGNGSWRNRSDCLTFSDPPDEVQGLKLRLKSLLEEKTNEPRKNPLTFHCTGCFIGILMVYYNPHITGQYNPHTNYQQPGFFSLLKWQTGGPAKLFGQAPEVLRCHPVVPGFWSESKFMKSCVKLSIKKLKPWKISFQPTW